MRTCQVDRPVMELTPLSFCTAPSGWKAHRVTLASLSATVANTWAPWNAGEQG
jgi:hypothetical protein